MPEKNNSDVLAKARAFFERAQKVAWSNNFDYAIDMYLEGLRCAPDAVEDGHVKLHGMAMVRQAKDGKKPSMVEKVKLMRGKTPLERMINAEYLFAKDPDNLGYAEAILKAALAGGYNKTVEWIADLCFEINSASKKPALHTYLLIKDAYCQLERFDKALSAEMTVARGKYDQDGDFRKAIKDPKKQEAMYAQERVIKTEDYRVTAVEDAQKAYLQQPNLSKNIFALADALADLQNDQGENEAMELLGKIYAEKKDFSYKERAGQVKIRQAKRKLRNAKAAVEGKGGDFKTDAEYCKLAEELNNIELEHYRLCVENYPTDQKAKYEYANLLLRNNRYDDAIPLFQEAERDPRHRIAAMNKIGICFFKKGWLTDAIDIFTQAIDTYESKEDRTAKELRYNLALACEANGDTEKALEIYRRIAQLDFAYKDVHQRVDKLRASPNA